MRSFTFDALPGRVVFGVGSLARLPEEVEHLGKQQVMVMADPTTKEIADEAAESLGARFAGLFSDIKLHVPMEAVAEARKAAEAAGADCLVTIGGGTTTGFGKAVVLEGGLPLIAVPTTYAGSEMTPIYGITSNGRKRTGRDLRVLPKIVLYDPALTTSVPPEVTGPSGMNALAHCVEALYGKEANPITSLMAEEAIRALARGIPGSVHDPEDLEARSDALYGAYLAGAALAVVGMALHHRICHVLGGTYGLAHGEVNSVILPHAARFNQPAASEALARAARALGFEDAAAGLFDLAESVGAPTSLAALGMRREDLEEAARLATDPPPWNPRPVSQSDVLGLLMDAFEGQRPDPVAAP
ncbi:MAG TPA: maleylacetate reductase [Actinomycetota bacterium]|jgi:alcohol dehydrogenase class IV|nr:maleylacetate reductase [Actinomycetota bacterium]